MSVRFGITLSHPKNPSLRGGRAANPPLAQRSNSAADEAISHSDHRDPQPPNRTPYREISKISNCKSPAGTLATTVSPASWPSKAWPTGDFVEIFPAAMSASTGLTST